MRLLLCFALLISALSGQAQLSDYPKNYVGVFFASGYYTDRFETQFGPEFNGVDVTTIGVRYARRLTQNLYVQSQSFIAGDAGLFADIGVKVNFLVRHKIQPTGGLSIGTRLGFEKATNRYYNFGLDWHALPFLVINADVQSDFSVNTQWFKMGGTYKF